MRRPPPELDPAARRRLLERTVWRGREREDESRNGVAAYLERSRGRFAHTLGLLDAALPAREGLRVLELGGEPWLFTQLLLERGIEVTAGGLRPHEDATKELVTLAWSGRRARVSQRLFDAERERWPFPDAGFEAVLCMEVLEHLTFSPAHLLFEANRVLAPGGLLVLTTPNALAAPKLVAMLRGHSVHGAYSGFGAQARHNREFTPEEVRLALESANFSADVRTANLAGYETPDALARPLQLWAGARSGRAARRRDHIFAVARKAGPPRLVFPPELYRAFDREILRRLGAILPDELAGPVAQATPGPAPRPPS